MAKGELLSKMISLAVKAHEGQFDKAGVPYILHCLKVMHYLKTDDEELQCIAIGHDLVEDTEVFLIDIMDNFTDRIADGIWALTKQNDKTYEQYKAKVMTNPDAVRVKMCDLRHNMDIRRLKGIEPKDIERLARYAKFYQELKELNNIP